jgi:hypothetical protein
MQEISLPALITQFYSAAIGLLTASLFVPYRWIKMIIKTASAAGTPHIMQNRGSKAKTH